MDLKFVPINGCMPKDDTLRGEQCRSVDDVACDSQVLDVDCTSQLMPLRVSVYAPCIKGLGLEDAPDVCVNTVGPSHAEQGHGSADEGSLAGTSTRGELLLTDVGEHEESLAFIENMNIVEDNTCVLEHIMDV